MRYLLAAVCVALRKARSTRILIGLAWAAAWAPLGALLSVIWDPAAAADRIFVPVRAAPGLLCGVLFFAALGIAEPRRRLHEVSPYRAGAWGMTVGLSVGALPFGMSQPTTDLPMALLAAETIGPVAALSAVSALASVLSARVVKELRGGKASPRSRW